MIYSDFNPVERLNPLIKTAELHKVLNIALPILQMFGPTKTAATTIGFLQKVYPLAVQIKTSFQDGDKAKIASGVLQIAGATTTIALMILFPLPTMLATYSYQFYHDLNSLKNHLGTENRLAAEDFLRILNNLVYVGAALAGGPELLLLSLLAQAGKEIYQARYEFMRGEPLDGLANIVYASLRTYEAQYYAKEVYRDWFAEDIGQEKLEVLLVEAARIVSEKQAAVKTAPSKPQITKNQQTIEAEPIPSGQPPVIENTIRELFANLLRRLVALTPSLNDIIAKLITKVVIIFFKKKKEYDFFNKSVDFDHILKLNNFSKRLKKLTIKNKDISGITFDSISFKACRILDNKFSNSSFLNSKFEDSEFIHNEFNKVLIEKCMFLNSSFYSNKIFNFKIIESVFGNITFNHCHFENGEWISSTLSQVMMNVSNICANVFEKCTLNHSQISGEFKFTTFTDCETKRLRMVSNGEENTHISECKFVKSRLVASEFNGSSIMKTLFEECDLTGTVFNDASLWSDVFNSCRMPEVSFFDVKTDANTAIIKSDLTNTLFFDSLKLFTIRDSTPNEITKPVIAMFWYFEGSGTPHANAMRNAIQKAGGIAFRVQYESKNVDSHKLDIETISLLDQMGNVPSRPQALLAKASPKGEIAKIKNLASRAAGYIDGVFLPGGEDIQPYLYSKKPDRANHDGFSRSMAEFAFLDEAKKRKLAVLGVCRGSQVINVFLGGTLIQHVDGHGGEIHDLKIAPETLKSKEGQIAQDILGGDRILGYSNHHQALGKPGDGVVPVLFHDGNVEMTISEEGRFVGTQFHPEAYYMDFIKASLDNKKFMPQYERSFVHELFDRNPNIFRYFISRAQKAKETAQHS